MKVQLRVYKHSIDVNINMSEKSLTVKKCFLGASKVLVYKPRAFNNGVNQALMNRF